ncbi:MAG: S8 family serine peptidase [Pirellulaceae bacterium]
MRRLFLEKLESRRLLSASPGYAEDRILVRFADAAESSASRIASEIVRGASVDREFQIVPGLRQVHLPNGLTVEAALQAYRHNPQVLYAEPDYRLHVSYIPNDPRFDELWGMNNVGQTSGTIDADIDAAEAWEVSTGSGRTVVAVIDTGVDYSHEDLAQNVWTNSQEFGGQAGVDDDGNGFVDDVYGYDFVNNDGDPMDDHSHGTHVAGTIGAVGNNGLGVTGVNWNIQIMAVKAFAADGSGSTSDAINAINYAVAQGALISNNSWGGNEPFSQAMYEAIAAARGTGHIFVAGAGNGYFGLFPLDNDVNPFYPASYDLDNIIAVAATDHNDNMAGFSNYGATSVDLAAPGVDILSTKPGNAYGLSSGTSMATPHVTGVVALVRDLHPDWTYDRVIAQVLESVQPIDALQGKLVTGGRLNAADAVADDTVGPRIASIPDRVFAPLHSLTLTFDKSVDVETFSAATIVSFQGPAGPITVDSVNVVPDSRDRAFEIIFAEQVVTGTYSIVIASTISDKNGNLLNQDGDDINGEALDDQFAGQFDLAEAIVRLDFGKSTTPVAADYTSVVETDLYVPSVGYGWQDSTMNSYDRASGGDLLRDFHFGPQGTFLVDLPNGRYEVVLTMGDAGGLHDQMGVYLEGTHVDTVSTAAGQYAVNSYFVDVNDGQLTLQLVDLGGTNANVVINGLEVIVEGPDRLGPQVVEVLPVGVVFGGTDRITLRFNEAIDGASFTANDVSLLDPAGSAIPLSVTRLSDATFQVTFAMLGEPGQYQLRVGPEISDLAGNLLDQDTDGIGGELPEDQYATSFTVETSLRLDFGLSTSPVAAGYRRVVETDLYAVSAGFGWQEKTMNSYDRASGGDLLRDFHFAPQGTFLVDLPNGRYDVVLSMGDAGGVHDQMGVFLEGTQVDTVSTAAGQYVIKTYTVAVDDGQLTLQLIDQGGTNANVVINGLEVIVVGPDLLGPQVVEVFPVGAIFGGTDRITLTFNEAIDGASFTADDVSLLDPAGSAIPLSVTRLSDVTFQVTFAMLGEPGQYQLRVGPEISDLAGNLLDQDQDGIGGELPEDQYATSFIVETSLRLDFGLSTSPVAAGYARVVATDLYAASIGYGWQKTMNGYDRGSGGDLLRDFHFAPQGTFLVDLPNGRYDVVLSMGDAGGLHDQMGVFLEGTQIDTVSTAAGQYAIKTYTVTVDDGQLTLQLIDQGGTNANVVINGLEVIVVGPDLLGPKVVGMVPSGKVFPSMDRLELRFSEPIDVNSFAADDLSLIGPMGSVGPLTVTRLDEVTFEVAFARSHEPGQYQLLVGPQITDLAGNLLDQDGDGAGGEQLEDQYAASFILETSLRLDFGLSTSPVAAGYAKVVGTDLYVASVGYGWQKTMNGYDRGSSGDLLRDFHFAPQGTFLVDLPDGRYEVVLSMGDAGGLHDQMGVYLEGTQVDTVSTAAGQYAINSYFVDVNDGQLTLQLVDLGGTNANVVINGLEVIVVGPDRLGPQVVKVSPVGAIFGGTDRITLTFNEAIDGASFTADDVSLLDPAGSAIPLSVTQLSDVTFQVTFAMLGEPGQYQLRVGPEISDLAGNLLDQDTDGTGGELPEDQYATSFTVETSLRLDFGKSTSPVAAGYRRVVETDVYATAAGYGWQEKSMNSYDRVTGGDLLRDFHFAPQGTFLVDVPNGRYDVKLSMGDTGGLHDQMGVYLEGTQIDTVSTGAGQFAINSYVVDVYDGQLTLKLVDQGGTNANVVINALEVTFQAGSAGSMAVATMDAGRPIAFPAPQWKTAVDAPHRAASVRTSLGHSSAPTIVPRGQELRVGKSTISSPYAVGDTDGTANLGTGQHARKQCFAELTDDELQEMLREND